MRYKVIIGILCVMLASIGNVCAYTYTFTDSYDGTFATGQVTFDENGVINGGMIAGVSNGNMDVQQDSYNDAGTVAVWQYGEIEGQHGFAGTLVDDGNGNSGGNFASFTDGSMGIGQVSAGGDTSYGPLGFGGNSLVFTGSPLSAAYPLVISLGGVINGQIGEIEGSSGYASTWAGNLNGATAGSTASFRNGDMLCGQVSGAGGVSLAFPYNLTTSLLGIDGPLQADQADVSIGGVITGQGVDMGGSSGSASTTVTDRNGATARNSASFTEGGMGAIQVSGAGDVSLAFPYNLTSSLFGMDSPLQADQADVSIGGIITGQSVDMGGSSGSASTIVTDRNGATARNSASFTEGGMGAIQVSGAGDVSLAFLYNLTSSLFGMDSPLQADQADVSIGGVITGQVGEIEGSSGSASTSVMNVNGNSAGNFAAFTEGYMEVGQLSAGISVLNLSFVPVSELSGVLSLQDVYSDQFSAISASSFSQIAGESYAQVNAQAQGSGLFCQPGVLSIDHNVLDTTQFAGGVTSGDQDITIAGADVWIYGVGAGSAGGISFDSNGNMASVQINVTDGNLTAEGESIIPGIIAGAGDLGAVSRALAGHTNVEISGSAGGILLDSQNSLGDYAYVYSEFSGSGNLYSDRFGGALSGQSSDTRLIGALDVLNMTPTDPTTTYLLETGTSGATNSSSSTGVTLSPLSWGDGVPGSPVHHSIFL